MKPIDRLGFGPKREAVFADGKWAVTVTPPEWSGFSASIIRLTEDQYARFEMWLKDGGLIQHMLPELSKEDREILISGIGPEDWETL